jgi:hypothetical protein
MSADEMRKAELAALEALLDSHGGNSERWPEPARARFGVLIDEEPAARRLVAEARALDAVLARAPTVGDARERALADRIAAAAASQIGNVVELDRHRKRQAPAEGPQRSRRWQAIGMMAASLVAGVLIGVTDVGGLMVEDLANLIAAEGDTFTTTLNLTVDGAADEEAL